MKGLVNKDTFKEILLNSHAKVFVYLRIMTWKVFLKMWFVVSTLAEN